MKEFTVADLLKVLDGIEKPESVKIAGSMKVDAIGLSGNVSKAEITKAGLVLNFSNVSMSTD